MSLDLLWTNPNTSVAFNPQTIKLDLSKYNFILIYTSFSARTNINGWQLCSKNKRTTLLVFSGNNSYRNVDFDDEKIDFGSGYWYSTYNNSGSINNERNIPIEIYGIRF